MSMNWALILSVWDGKNNNRENWERYLRRREYNQEPNQEKGQCVMRVRFGVFFASPRMCRRKTFKAGYCLVKANSFRTREEKARRMKVCTKQTHEGKKRKKSLWAKRRRIPPIFALKDSGRGRHENTLGKHGLLKRKDKTPSFAPEMLSTDYDGIFPHVS